MFGITFGMVAGFVIGVIVCAIIVFFIWKNNKQKFVTALLDIDEVVNKYDTIAEVEAKIDEIITQIKVKK